MIPSNSFEDLQQQQPIREILEITFEIANSMSQPTATPEMVRNDSLFTQPMTQIQLQQVVSEMYSQLQQHSHLFQELALLKEKVISLEKDNMTLADENAQLKRKLIESQQNSKSSVTDFPALNNDLSNHQQENNSRTDATNNNTYSDIAKKHIPPQQKKKAPSMTKRISAARLFKTPESRGPQGFQYVYIGRSRKILRSEVRSRLRRAGIDTGRVLDICFPASGVLGLLLHVQYVDTFKETMEKVGADIINNFDPLDPKHLADPKYKDKSESERAGVMINLVNERALDTLDNLSPFQVESVSRYFVTLGYIDDADAAQALRDARERLSEEDPKRAKFFFSSKITADEDSAMDEEL